MKKTKIEKILDEVEAMEVEGWEMINDGVISLSFLKEHDLFVFKSIFPIDEENYLTEKLAKELLKKYKPYEVKKDLQ